MKIHNKHKHTQHKSKAVNENTAATRKSRWTSSTCLEAVFASFWPPSAPFSIAFYFGRFLPPVCIPSIAGDLTGQKRPTL